VALSVWTRAVAEYVAICKWGEAVAVGTFCEATPQAGKSMTRTPRMGMIAFQCIVITFLLSHLAGIWV
jgi:hypothetical protein